MPNSDGKLKNTSEPRTIRNRLDTFGQVATPTKIFRNDSDRQSSEELKVSPTCWDQNLRAVEIPKPQEDNGFFSELPGTVNDTASPMSFLTKNYGLDHLNESTNTVSSASSMLDTSDQGSTSRIEKSAVKPKRMYIPPHKRRAMKTAQSDVSKNSANSTSGSSDSCKSYSSSPSKTVLTHFAISQLNSSQMKRSGSSSMPSSPDRLRRNSDDSKRLSPKTMLYSPRSETSSHRGSIGSADSLDLGFGEMEMDDQTVGDEVGHIQQGSELHTATLVSNMVDSTNDNSFGNNNNLSALGLLIQGRQKEMASSTFRNRTKLICRSGFASDIGTRSRMEDEICLFDDFNTYFKKETRDKMAQYLANESYIRNELSSSYDDNKNSSKFLIKLPLHSYYAVYDGHGGTFAAKYVQEHLHTMICDHPDFAHPESDLKQCIHDVFKTLDKRLLKTQVYGDETGTGIAKKKKIDHSGTTAVLSLIRGNTLYAAILGDSRIVLSRGGNTVELLQPHSPGNDKEKKRIESVNGWVSHEKELLISRLRNMDLNDPFIKEKAQRQNFVHIYRVNGDLGVSRAFGDPEFKEPLQNDPDAFWSWPKGHSKTFSSSLVVSEPDVCTCNLTPEDDFLILACDGLWDVLTPREAVEKVTEYFAEKGMDESIASQKLLNLASRLGSTDNISIVIVRLTFVNV